ncbi:hypothetical protein, partial [Staphylococcus felis]|uniref:hypothetical protein n=1 Tax=Staphylococcus felis TaxID=46127 RepID=UPI00115BB41C
MARGSGVFASGASGAIVSVTVPVPGSDVLPLLSLLTTVMISHSSSTSVGGTDTLQFPFSSTFPVPVSPFGNVTTTVVPGSPVPVTSLSHSCGLFTFGASGAIVSVTVPVPGSDV